MSKSIVKYVPKPKTNALLLLLLRRRGRGVRHRLHLRVILFLGQEGVVVALVHISKGVVHFPVRGLVLTDSQEQVTEGGVGACGCMCGFV